MTWAWTRRLEVAVARQHRGHHQIALGDRSRHRVRERPGVADAGGTAVSHQVEAELGQRVQQPGLPEVLGDHGGAGGEAGLDVGRHREPAPQCVAGEDARPEHHRRVGGVGAGGDRRDHHRAVTDGGAVTVGGDGGAALPLGRGQREAALRLGRRQAGAERLLHARQGHPILRALGAGQRRLDRAQIQLQQLAELRFRRFRAAEQSLLLAVRLHQRHRGRVAAGQPQIAQRLVVDRKEADRGAIFGRHVGDGRAVREAHGAQPRTGELHELAHHAMAAAATRPPPA